jgi:hypothetical protein
LSARFSLSDFPGFLLFDFLGDLSAMRSKGNPRRPVPAPEFRDASRTGGTYVWAART